MPITGEDLAAVRAELHAPIEQLDLLNALDVRDFVRDIVHDPDELSDAERALVAEGEAQIDRGSTRRWKSSRPAIAAVPQDDRRTVIERRHVLSS